MIAMARAGRDSQAPLGLEGEHQFIDPIFHDAGKTPEEIARTADGKAAVLHTLSTEDWVIDIHGVAGAGKTTLMKEAIPGIESGGHEVFTFAPTIGATKVLQGEGFAEAKTLQHLLLNQQLQDRMSGNVIWLDESGAVGTKDMLQLFEIAKAQQARIVLSGDTRQIASVPRGDALRILQEEGAVKPVELTTIHRQRHEQYRACSSSR